MRVCHGGVSGQGLDDTGLIVYGLGWLIFKEKARTFLGVWAGCVLPPEDADYEIGVGWNPEAENEIYAYLCYKRETQKFIVKAVLTPIPERSDAEGDISDQLKHSDLSDHTI